jgi:DNA-binding beta-propeller fold protein YncE
MKLDMSGVRLFVNVPDANHVAVVEPAGAKVAKTWAIPDGKKNGPMALNQAERRLYVATRNPAKFFAYDTDSRKVLASMATVGGAGDMFFDEKRRQVYVSGGDGYISVLEDDDADHYRDLGKLLTGLCLSSTRFTSPRRRRAARQPY